MKQLVIVESPTKAKTLNKFLGKDYQVVASMGHVRDIPSNRMNIDVDNDFTPVYEVDSKKKKTVKDITSKAKKADKIILATDPDREGEAISYHIQHLITEALGRKATPDKFARITFHQITKAAVEEAMSHAGEVDQKLVEAQQARRILDRLVGYSLSPVLWRKVRRGLSAGRVQSVALRLVVEREREIEAFKPQEYWEVKVEVSPEETKDKFWIDLVEVDGKKLQTKKGDNRKFLLDSAEVAEPVVADLRQAKYVVKSVIRKQKKRSPKPPFTTSTLQQAAANALGYTSNRTMRYAQQLYEQGYITYHRTDSFYLAKEAVAMARGYIEKTFGQDYLPAKTRGYRTKSKSAQEAHEAIRPTDVKLTGKDLNQVEAPARRLFDLIKRRFIACQMADAIYDATRVDVEAKGEKHLSLLRANGSIMKFPGWRAVYAGAKSGQDEDSILPEVTEKQSLKYWDLNHEQKFTQPPARYNDASLVKQLESMGIGRPSTYAPTISTLIARGYMQRNERRFQPTPIGMTVTDFLVDHFDEVLDYNFTAQMEDDLDKIAEGKKDWVPMMREFWKPFDDKVSKVIDRADRVKVPVEKTGKACPECGDAENGEVVIRSGKYGKFLSCSRFPDCKYTGKYEQVVDDMDCPECGQGKVVLKRTRKGRNFYGCNRYPDCKFASWKKPKVG